MTCVPGRPAAALAVLLVLAACALGSPGAHAQALSSAAGKALGRPGAAIATAATQRDPARLRAVLRSLHGFSRATLDAASADVPAVLKAIIDGSSETTLLLRQAIKALALYPNADTLAFVQSHLSSAPTDLKRLYLVGLARFGAVDAAAVSAALDQALGATDVTVRWAAATSAAALAGHAAVQAVLARHAATEQNAALRQTLGQALAPH